MWKRGNDVCCFCRAHYRSADVKGFALKYLWYLPVVFQVYCSLWTGILHILSLISVKVGVWCLYTVNLKFQGLVFLPQLGRPTVGFWEGFMQSLCGSCKRSLNLLSLFERTFKDLLDRWCECIQCALEKAFKLLLSRLRAAGSWGIQGWSWVKGSRTTLQREQSSSGCDALGRSREMNLEVDCASDFKQGFSISGGPKTGS